MRCCSTPERDAVVLRLVCAPYRTWPERGTPLRPGRQCTPGARNLSDSIRAGARKLDHLNPQMQINVIR